MRKGQADALNIARDIRGELRLVERAFGISPNPLAEVMAFADQMLGRKAA